MSDLNEFEQLLEGSLKTIHTGEVVEGTVIDVKEDEIVLNIGYKADGIISRNEYTNVPNVDLRDQVHVGDVLSAKVLKVNDGDGQVLLSARRVRAEKASKVLEEAFENKTPLTAKVAQALNGGLSVIVDEVKVFIPASLVSDVYEKDLSKFEGQDVTFVITEYNPKKRRVIGDCKQLIVAKKKEFMDNFLSGLRVGDVIDGTVKNITDFGAFIDLGGVDGLLHVSEMAWGKTENPKKAYSVGQQVRVFVKEIKDSKISLSVKFPDTNPWAIAEKNYNVGDVVTGKVARLTEFGAFVELADGLDALLHVSQIAKEHIEKPSDVLKVGQEITAKIIGLNFENKRISISIRALLSKNDDEVAEESAEQTEE